MQRYGDQEIVDLSNYGGSSYDGEYDDQINHLGGAPGEGGFGTQFSMAKNYIFSVNNTSAAAQKILFNNFYGNAEAGRVLREGVIPYAIGATDLVCASENSDMNVLMDWLQNNPTMILGQQLEVTDVAQFNQKYYQRAGINPIFPTAAKEIINLTTYKDTYAQNAKLIRVAVPFILDKETETYLVIPPACKTTFTWSIGVHASFAASFRAKAVKAQGNPNVRSQQAANGVGTIAIGGAGLPGRGNTSGSMQLVGA